MSSGVPALSEGTTGVAQDRGNSYVSAQTVSFTVDTTTAPLGAVGGILYTINNAGATTCTLPAGTVTAYPVGYVIRLASIGAGTCTITAGAGATVTVNSAVAVATSTNRTIVKTAVSTWIVL